MAKEIRPYGIWNSPLSAQAVAGGARRFGDVAGDGAWVYWTEGRPSEEGRQVIMRASPGSDGIAGIAAEDVLLPPFSARSRVHEYGGGEFLVCDDVVYFVNDADQDIYVLGTGAGADIQPERLTSESRLRFGGAILDAPRQRLISVAERQASTGSAHPENLLMEISLVAASRGQVTELATGHDFYASPTLSPDGSRLAWLAWDLPDMPWDNAGLYVADIDGAGRLGPAQLVAGGRDSAAMQPSWLDDRQLIYISDKTGWGNLYRWDGSASQPIHSAAAELGRPLWQLGMSSYALAQQSGTQGEQAAAIIASFFADGVFQFARIDAAAGDLTRRDLPFPLVDDLCSYAGGIAAIAGRHDAPPAIVAIPHEVTASPMILRSAADIELDPESISRAEVMRFPGGAGKDVFGLYYPPVNAGFAAPDGDLPPAIITAHGGPTTSADRGLKLRTQYYTSRGFAVFDVDYAGSTSYGRAYRERLDGKWGIADVADCAAAAGYLAAQGLADQARIAIQGGSAGGYTVLMALATTDVFAAGSCHYGISDLELLQQHTHKFESGYLHRLLGTSPDDFQETFAARSPLALIDGITSPLILFQGLDDKVVPPEQSQLIADRLRAKGLEVACHEFAGEGHGFRRADTIVAVLEAELAFLQQALGVDRENGT